jgi:hypothetical protein
MCINVIVQRGTHRSESKRIADMQHQDWYNVWGRTLLIAQTAVTHFAASHSDPWGRFRILLSSVMWHQDVQPLSIKFETERRAGGLYSTFPRNRPTFTYAEILNQSRNFIFWYTGTDVLEEHAASISTAEGQGECKQNYMVLYVSILLHCIVQ